MRNLAALLILLVSPLATHATEKVIIGWIETVQIHPEAFQLEAKIDTGADNSSVDAYEIEHYSKSGTAWVRFKLLSNTGKSITLEKPLMAKTRIKRKQGSSIERPVVMLDICLGKQHYTAEVNLSKRKNFKYRMIIGRSFLSGRYLVDTSKENVGPPACDISN